MTDQPSALTIARFLQDNPSFFSEHAELFAALTVPHPNQPSAISLGERQILVLRDKLKSLDMRLATLSYQASFNESVADKLNQWCARMLAEPDPSHLPGHIIIGLGQAFDLSDIALRVWGLNLPDQGIAQPVAEEVKTFAASLSGPYCGPNKEFAASTWLSAPPASMAIIPLRAAAESEPLGLLVIGSSDPERYTQDMATDFLQTIGLLAGAALSRLDIQAESV